MFFVQLSLALMFIAIGVMDITNYNSDISQFARSFSKLIGKNNDIVPVLFAVLELVSGILLLVSLFTGASGKFLSVALVIIFIFWAITIIMNYFMNGLFEPDFIDWLSRVSPQLVILSALWLVSSSRY
jgi:uncharacterized membrane protein YphA (DoxX/SURF4 family)